MLLLLLACDPGPLTLADDTAGDSGLDSSSDTSDTGDSAGETGETGDSAETGETGDSGETGETGTPTGATGIATDQCAPDDGPALELHFSADPACGAGAPTTEWVRLTLFHGSTSAPPIGQVFGTATGDAWATRYPDGGTTGGIDATSLSTSLLSTDGALVHVWMEAEWADGTRSELTTDLTVCPAEVACG